MLRRGRRAVTGSGVGAGVEATWLIEEARLRHDEEVAPGLTRGEVLAFHSRPPTPKGWIYEPDVAVGHARLHLYRPAVVDGARPGVVLVHGGAWTAGHPFQHIRRAALLAAGGRLAATISYRSAVVAPWPACAEDLRASIDWLRAQAPRLGLDPARLSIAGDSAGGQLAARAASTPELGLTAAVLWYPVLDLGAVPALVREVELLTNGDPAALADADPIRHAGRTRTPVLTFAGVADEVVPVAGARSFHAILDRAGVDNELVEIAGAGHAFDFDPSAWTSTFEQTVRFLDRIDGGYRPSPS